MASFTRPQSKKAESVTAVWTDGAISIELPEDATLADLAEMVETRGRGRPLYVGVTFTTPSAGNA